ncbi:hypothetical protein [Sorangium sp. So ce388]|uniref:hypothetical protein n=1 Tax=Sorangium sp. So ce388 TaxID=3133309 RepID=UPI003F5B3850
MAKPPQGMLDQLRDMGFELAPDLRRLSAVAAQAHAYRRQQGRLGRQARRSPDLDELSRSTVFYAAYQVNSAVREALEASGFRSARYERLTGLEEFAPRDTQVDDASPVSEAVLAGLDRYRSKRRERRALGAAGLVVSILETATMGPFGDRFSTAGGGRSSPAPGRSSPGWRASRRLPPRRPTPRSPGPSGFWRRSRPRQTR